MSRTSPAPECILYYHSEDVHSQKALALVRGSPSLARTVQVRDIKTLPRIQWPVWLNGVPILAIIRDRRILRGKHCLEYLREASQGTATTATATTTATGTGEGSSPTDFLPAAVSSAKSSATVSSFESSGMSTFQFDLDKKITEADLEKFQQNREQLYGSGENDAEAIEKARREFREAFGTSAGEGGRIR